MAVEARRILPRSQSQRLRGCPDYEVQGKHPVLIAVNGKLKENARTFWQVQNTTTFKWSSQFLHYQEHNISWPPTSNKLVIANMYSVISKWYILSVKCIAWTQYRRDDPQGKDFVKMSPILTYNSVLFFMHNLFGQHRYLFIFISSKGTEPRTILFFFDE